MNIVEVVSTIIRGEQAIKFPLTNRDGWIADANSNHILDVRGWGYLQYHDKGEQAAADVQDAIGDWVVATLNAEASRLGLMTL